MPYKETPKGLPTPFSNQYHKWLARLLHFHKPSSSIPAPISPEESRRNAQDVIGRRATAEAREAELAREAAEVEDANDKTNVLERLKRISLTHAGKLKQRRLIRQTRARMDSIGIAGVGVVALPMTGLDFRFDELTGKISYEGKPDRYAVLARQTISTFQEVLLGAITHPTRMQYGETWVTHLQSNPPPGYAKDHTVTRIDGSSEPFKAWLGNDHVALIFAWEKRGASSSLFEVSMERLKTLAKDLHLNIYVADDSTGHVDYPGEIFMG